MFEKIGDKDKRAQERKRLDQKKLERRIFELRNLRLNNPNFDPAVQHTHLKEEQEVELALKRFRPVKPNHFVDSPFIKDKIFVGECICDDGEERWLWEDNANYYTWDDHHLGGEIEVFLKKTKGHIGVLNSQGGIKNKKATPFRKIVSIRK
jgi:hypothetical protein